MELWGASTILTIVVVMGSVVGTRATFGCAQFASCTCQPPWSGEDCTAARYGKPVTNGFGIALLNNEQLLFEASTDLMIWTPANNVSTLQRLPAHYYDISSIVVFSLMDTAAQVARADVPAVTTVDFSRPILHQLNATQLIITGSETGTIKVWRITSNQLPVTTADIHLHLTRHRRVAEIKTLAISGTGHVLAAIGKGVQIINTATGSPICSLDVISNTSSSIVIPFSPTHAVFLSTNTSRLLGHSAVLLTSEGLQPAIRFWDALTCQELGTTLSADGLAFLGQGVNHFVVDEDVRRLYAVGESSRIAGYQLAQDWSKGILLYDRVLKLDDEAETAWEHVTLLKQSHTLVVRGKERNSRLVNASTGDLLLGNVPLKTRVRLVLPSSFDFGSTVASSVASCAAVLATPLVAVGFQLECFKEDVLPVYTLEAGALRNQVAAAFNHPWAALLQSTNLTVVRSPSLDVVWTRSRSSLGIEAGLFYFIKYSRNDKLIAIAGNQQQGLVIILNASTGSVVTSQFVGGVTAMEILNDVVLLIDTSDRLHVYELRQGLNLIKTVTVSTEPAADLQRQGLAVPSLDQQHLVLKLFDDPFQQWQLNFSVANGTARQVSMSKTLDLTNDYKQSMLAPIPDSNDVLVDCRTSICRVSPNNPGILRLQRSGVGLRPDAVDEVGTINGLGTNGLLAASGASIMSARLYSLVSNSPFWERATYLGKGEGAAVTADGLAFFAFRSNVIEAKAVTWPFIRVFVGNIELRNNTVLPLSYTLKDEVKVEIETRSGALPSSQQGPGPGGARVLRGEVGLHIIAYTARDTAQSYNDVAQFQARVRLYDDVSPTIPYLAAVDVYPIDLAQPNVLPPQLQAIDEVDGDITDNVTVTVEDQHVILACQDASGNILNVRMLYKALGSTPPPAASTSKGSNTGVIVGVVVGLLLLIVVLAVVLARRQRLSAVAVAKTQAAEDMHSLLKQASQSLFAASTTSSASSFGIFGPEDVRLGEVLGEGNFSKVWQASLLQDGRAEQAVAVKVLKPSPGATSGKDHLTELMQEAFLMHSCKHPNVVQVFGMVSSTPPGLVMALASHDLKTWLRTQRQRGRSVDSATRLLMLQQVADGLACLHARKIVHRDLAARNVLVMSEQPLAVALGDFGLTRVLQADDDYYAPSQLHALPFRWMSPEALQQARFTMQSDIWALGIVGYEIATGGKTPYGALGYHEVLAFLKAHKRLAVPEEQVGLKTVVDACWQSSQSRPSAITVSQLAKTQRDRLAHVCLDDTPAEETSL
eukprot:m.174629 g.174629  ORF g.174629 m.174629 type:complete len:1272 (+) comp16754_c0_seq3:122-3937(+)